MPLRCLIVDDNDDFLTSATHLLESQGVKVVGRASSEHAALQLSERLNPDVALVDVQLGDEDGFEVTRRLSSAAQATPVILISTHAEDDLADLLEESPALGFLAKRALSADAIRSLLA